MSDYIPVSFPAPPDDVHIWARPASPPCPDCTCCSAALCELARGDRSACWLVGDHGSPGVMDTTSCPCVPAAGGAAR